MNLNTKNVFEENNLSYWLNFLESRTKGEIKLVLVGTHGDLLSNGEISEKKETVKKRITETIKTYQLKIEINLDKDFFVVGTTAKFYTRELNDFKKYFKRGKISLIF